MAKANQLVSACKVEKAKADQFEPGSDLLRFESGCLEVAVWASGIAWIHPVLYEFMGGLGLKNIGIVTISESM
jgi:hypothetical protein